MSVFLSPVGGAGAQFFDNNGNPLTGGKLYTYAAGTTTPQATYTSAAGATFHTNPIILDAAGRVPGSSEIWLTDSQIYKFVLKDSNDVLLATWDQITGVNSNFVNYTTETEVQTATAGQTVFTLTTMSYAPGTGSLTVFVDGVNQYENTSYLETNSTTVTFTAGLHVGALVKFTTAIQTTGNATDASVVTYTAPYSGAVQTTVENKLAQYVSVKDFGAVGDGVTDDTAAIQAALDTGNDVIFPDAVYRITAQLTVGSQKLFGGVGAKSINRAQSIISVAGNHPCFVNGSGEISFEIDGFYIDYGASVPTNAGTSSNKIGFYFTTNTLWPAFSKISNCTVRGAWEAYYDNTGTYQSILERVFALNCRRSFFKQNGTTIKFDTCMAQGGKQGFYIVDVLSPTLVNVAADQLVVGTTENTGNYFEGCRSLTIAGWDAESNAISGDTVSYIRIRQSAGHVSGFVGYVNTLNCTSGQEVYLFKVDEGSTVTFSGCQPARNVGDLEFLGAGGGSPHTLLAYDTSKVFLSGCNFSAPTGGTPTVSYVANAQLASSIQYAQSLVSGTSVNTFDSGYGPTSSGTWAPSISGFTVVGSPTVTGRYVRDNNVVHCWVQFDCSVGNTVASVAGVSVIDNFPALLTPTQRGVCMASNEAVASFGNGVVTTIGTYTPAWSASSVDVYVQFSYYIG